MFTPLPFLPLIVLFVLCAYSLATCRLQLQVVKGSATVILSAQYYKLCLIAACLKCSLRLSMSPGTGAFKFANWGDWRLQVWELGITFRLPMSPGTGTFKLGTSFYNLFCLTAPALFLQLDIAIERKCIALYGYFLVM
ncbi:hypothetical protein F4604DRAFT_1690246 [Suillus subluteus]|nr:hypothetical protein F4604DRAFT_1690246 [Suillus subluteus]